MKWFLGAGLLLHAGLELRAGAELLFEHDDAVRGRLDGGLFQGQRGVVQRLLRLADAGVFALEEGAAGVVVRSCPGGR